MIIVIDLESDKYQEFIVDFEKICEKYNLDFAMWTTDGGDVMAHIFEIEEENK